MKTNNLLVRLMIPSVLGLFMLTAIDLPAQQQDWKIYTWETNLEQALARAKQEDKKVLVFFAGSDWCVWCHRLTDEVLETDRFQGFMDSFVVPVLIDFPRTIPISAQQLAYNTSLAHRYAVSGYPTVFILDANGGMRLRTGYQRGGADAYISHLLPAVQ